MLTLLTSLLLLSPILTLYPFRTTDRSFDRAPFLLSELTFPIAKQEIDNLIVYLHDPHCIPCRSFRSKFIQAHSEIRRQVPRPTSISFGIVDVSLEYHIARDLNISYFPAIVHYQNGEFLREHPGPYTGDFASQFLIKWVFSESSLLYRRLDTVSAREIFGSQDIAVIVLQEEPIANETANLVRDLTSKYRSYVNFFRTKSEMMQGEYSVGSKPGEWILLATRSGYNKTYDKEEMMEWLRNDLEVMIEQLPKILDESLAKTIENVPDVYFCFFSRRDQDDFAERKAYQSAVSDSRLGNFKSCRADVDSVLGLTLLNRLGIEDNELPAAGILDTRESVIMKYKFNGEINAENLANFYVNSIMDGSSQYLVKNSQEASIEKGNDHIITLSINNFEEAKKIDQKVLLVLYCAPLEKGCREFESTFKVLAYQLRNSKVDLGRMDVSKNDLDEKIEEYPLLKWYSKEGRDGVMYTGKKNIMYIKRWLKSLSVEFDD